MDGILITGFEPFGGERVNPSWEVARSLDGVAIAGRQVVAARLPCVFGEGFDVFAAAVGRLKPALCLLLGEAGGRAAISVERFAVNLDDARMPDNAGTRPVADEIEPGGPVACRAGIPVEAAVAAVQAAGLPAELSNSAGTYVCNHVFYRASRLAEVAGGKPAVGFVHLPYLPEQVAALPGRPSMSLETMARGVRIVAETALAASSRDRTHRKS